MLLFGHAKTLLVLLLPSRFIPLLPSRFTSLPSRFTPLSSRSNSSSRFIPPFPSRFTPPLPSRFTPPLPYRFTPFLLLFLLLFHLIYSSSPSRSTPPLPARFTPLPSRSIPLPSRFTPLLSRFTPLLSHFYSSCNPLCAELCYQDISVTGDLILPTVRHLIELIIHSLGGIDIINSAVHCEVVFVLQEQMGENFGICARNAFRYSFLFFF